MNVNEKSSHCVTKSRLRLPKVLTAVRSVLKKYVVLVTLPLHPARYSLSEIFSEDYLCVLFLNKKTIFARLSFALF